MNNLYESLKAKQPKFVWRRTFDNFELDEKKLFTKIGPKELALSQSERFVSWALDCYGRTPNGLTHYGKFGLYLYGPAGVGKSHLAAAVTNRLIENGIDTLFLPIDRLPRNDSDAIANLGSAEMLPVLVLDDVGAEKMTERSLECLFSVINGRLIEEGFTMITSNFSPENLARRLDSFDSGMYGQRLLGRIREMCEIAPIGGKDFREGM